MMVYYGSTFYYNNQMCVCVFEICDYIIVYHAIEEHFHDIILSTK